MKRIIAILLFTVSLSANAFDIRPEISIGHTTNTTNEAYSIGVTGKFADRVVLADGWRYRAGWATLGTPYLNLDASMSNADEMLANRPGQTYPLHWIQPYRVKEVYLTVAPEWYFGEYTLSTEVGVAAYHPQMQEDLAPGESAPTGVPSRTNYTAIFGFSVGYGNASVVVSHQTITEYRDWLNGTPTSSMVTTSLRYRF